MSSEVKNTLWRAKDEVIALRRQNQLLSAQVAVVEVFAASLGLKPEQQGACVDVVWEIERAVQSLEQKPADVNSGEGGNDYSDGEFAQAEKQVHLRVPISDFQTDWRRCAIDLQLELNRAKGL
jgi:hypothetical protein